VKELSINGGYIPEIRIQNIIKKGILHGNSMITPLKNISGSTCIGLFGKLITEKSHPVLLSFIKTGIYLITG